MTQWTKESPALSLPSPLLVFGARVGGRRTFTLIEVILVLVIMAILASIAMPRFAGAVVNHRAEATAKRIAADLALAQQRAKIRSASQTVSFDVEANRYGLVGMQDVDHPNEPYEVRLSEDPYEATLIDANFADDAEIVFDGYGVPDSGGSVVVEVGNRQKTITVDPETGQAHVE